MARLRTSIDSIVTKPSLPPLDVVKFSGNPCQYFRFKSRFEEMVDTQKISEMSRLIRCSFLMAQLEVLLWALKECLVDWVRP